MTDDRETVSYDTVCKHIAPCGLNCNKCIAHTDGDVTRLSAALVDALGPNFSSYAQRFAAANRVFENYEAFRELLDHFAQGSVHRAATGCVPSSPAGSGNAS